MSLSGKKWIWPDQDHNSFFTLTEDLKYPPALTRLLINRGIKDPEQARAFLAPSTDQFHPPWAMHGMKEAVDRLLIAIKKNETIVIHGDYDADGISATVILVEALQQLGGKVDYYLPSRFEEGYGLHLEPLKEFKEAGCSLVVTVDCGINAVDEVAHAAKLGLDLIITDHHQPLERLSGALAVINPLQEACEYPFKELSGAGIAFKLASALMEETGAVFPDHLLDLAALGTAADVVPLLGENRIIVASGLEVLRSLQRVGFKALAEAVSLEKTRINSTALSFILAPSINAAGRMGAALPAARLLLEKDIEKASQLAGDLHRTNQSRRSREREILKEAEAAAVELLSIAENKVVTLARENWHHGVIGIVASRLVERFNRPVALIAIENGEGRGSARSIPGFDITAALADSSDLLEKFGGHEQAAGFTVQADHIDKLREKLNRYAGKNIDESRLNSCLYIEVELEEKEVDFNLTSELEVLQPHGNGNPEPLFGSRSWEIMSWRLVGNDQKHLKLSVRKGTRTLNPIVFSGAPLAAQLEKGRRMDLAFKMKSGSFRGRKTLDLEVIDLSYSDRAAIGDLELRDYRGSKNRAGILKEILEREKSEKVLFFAAQSRAEKIMNSISFEDPPFIITSGAMNSEPELPENPEILILYDLPLHDSILKTTLRQGLNRNKLKVYLLYNRADLRQNSLLTDISLPAKENLIKIKAVLEEAAKTGSSPDFAGQAEKTLDFKPAGSFWTRVESIFSEVGLLKNGRFSNEQVKLSSSWPECLDSSPTYLATEQLLESCEQFQHLLLKGTPAEIAAYLHNLGVG